MKIPQATIDWLLEIGSPAVRYGARLLAGGKKPDRAELLADPLVRESLRLLRGWDKEVIDRHNTPDLLLHQLALLVDFGVRVDDPGLDPVVKAILMRTNELGIPEIVVRIPKAFGGSDRPERAWLACDFPVVLYGLAGLGVKDRAMGKAFRTLESLVADNGYRCRGSFPKFRGPGRKDDPCPIACLYAAKALSLEERAAGSAAAQGAVEALLRHWEERKKKKYFMFGIGTDFMKLKFPFVWYNLLHVLEAVSRFPGFRKDARVREMADALLAKAEKGLRFRPESVYLVYKGHDFADKKNFSPTLTLMALRVLKRLGRVG